MFITNHYQCFQHIRIYPNAYNRFINEITLPLHTKLSDEDVDYVIENFKEIVSCL